MNGTPGQTPCDTPSFKAARNFSAGANPYALVTADFNADGELDLAVANAQSNFISVFLGSGTGNLAPVGNIPVTARSLDFNGDGKVDLADADGGNILVMFGNGFGGFSAPLTLKAGTNPLMVVASEFNGDGKPDLVAVNTNSDDISIFINDGSGGFLKAVNYPGRTAPGRLVVGDFNNDGKQDLISLPTTGSLANNATLLLGDGAGGFRAPISFGVGPATGIVAGDFNGDHNIDLVTTQLSSVSFLAGNGSGGFGAGVSVPSPVGIVAAGDVNKDGKLDLLGVNNIKNIVQVLFGNGAGSFTQSPTLYADGQPISAAFGDFNDDGNPDIAVANFSSSDVSLIRGDGQGGFEIPDNYELKAGWVQPGDFNNDGRIDLVATVTDNGKDKIQILLGNGGGFAAPSEFPLGNVAGISYVSDFNGDGKLDLAIPNLSANGISILFGDGNGNFSSRVDTPLAAAPSSFIIAGDFNNDGKTDVAVLSHSPFLVSVLLGDGAGHFSPAWSFNFDGDPAGIAVGDLNADGKVDIVITTVRTNAVRILLGQGNGMFGLVGNLQIGSDPSGVTLNDFNGDGKLDLAVTAADSSFVAVLLGNGAGGFAPPANFTVGGFPNSIVTGDLNGDGKLDLVVSNSVPNNLSLLLGDGTGKFKTLMTLGAGLGPRPIVAGDLNSDGRPDIAVLNQGTSSMMVFLSKACGTSFGTNQIDISNIFVRQQYNDFLNREPDPNGLAFWTNEMISCGADQHCIEAKRINVSAAFFLSIEFQETGYLVYRIYKAAYGNLSGAPVPIKRNEFLPDTQKIGQGVTVNQGNWQQQLENNKQAFTAEFVQRARFTAVFPSTMSAADFVDKLNSNAGNPLSPSERTQLVNDLSSNAQTRAQVLRAVAEDADLKSAEFNRAFVLMQYFGYLLRNPNDAPDSDFGGYNFWLTKLNSFDGDFVNADMVKAFITSGEYRQRFGTP